MADRFQDINIHGLRELEKRLQALPEKLRRKSIRKILGDAASIVREDAVRRVPVRKPAVGWMAFLEEDPTLMTGHLRDNIVQVVKVGKNNSVARIGIDCTKVRHGHLVEFGTAPHWIGRWKHPGAGKHPFMRPAFDAKAAESLDHIISNLRDAVEREA